ncbi:MAG: regulatory protein RecX [Microgenomates group bacterium]
MKQKSNSKFQKLLDKVYRFLALRPRSEKEIADYLKKRKIPDDLAQKIFKILKEQSLIADSAFAQWWIEQRTTFRPKGKIALKVELKQKGIAPEIIEKELEKIDELKLAKKAIQKKLEIYRRLSSQDFRQKISTFLSYRGFSWQTIKKILDNLP